jgi:hypothetical protein
MFVPINFSTVCWCWQAGFLAKERRSETFSSQDGTVFPYPMAVTIPQRTWFSQGERDSQFPPHAFQFFLAASSGKFGANNS